MSWRKGGDPARRASLSRRLVGLVVAAVGTGMIVSASVSVWQQSVQYAQGRRDLLLATAQVFSAAVAAPAFDRNAPGALASIRAIGKVPDILYAEVQTTDGFALATLGSAPRLVSDFSADADQSVFAMFSSRTVQVSAPIVHGGQPAGRLILIGGTAGFWERLLATLAMTAVGGLVALMVGLLVAWRFQYGITKPLHQLMRAMADIREHHKYNVSISDAGDREIGLLVDGFKAMLGDIHERDARLDAHRRNLEREVADRTRDMREARDAAEKANAAKSEFLATMSHEIRTPMNGIMVMAELLACSDMPARQQRYAEVIANSGQSLLAIINDILDFSKIESGKLALESVPVDLVKLGETVVTLFAERARSKNIDLAALIDPATPRQIVGDPVRLSQIASNLVNNALKFTESGFVLLTIAPAAEECLAISVADTGIGIPADKIGTIFDAFSQADQSTTRQFGGTGLGLSICSRLATAMGGRIDVASVVGKGSTFTVTIPVGDAMEVRSWPSGDQGEVVVDVAGEATALVAARYLAAFGKKAVATDGRSGADQYAMNALACVDADRLPGLAWGKRRERERVVIAVAPFADESADRLIEEGLADAVLSRPLLRSELEDVFVRLAAGESVLQVREARGQVSTAQFSGLKVLVADDTALNLEVAVEALGRLGITADTVQSGAEAIEAVREKEFDIVLMDCSMPDIDGFTATRTIRAWEAGAGRQRVPIIALTAQVAGMKADAWREAGMDGVVHKPYTLLQLAACLQRVFPNASARQEESVAAPINKTDTAKGDLLDENVLQNLREMGGRGNTGFVRRVFDLYLENAPPAAEEALKAVRGGDLAGCARAVHALKSMSYNIGAARVAALAGPIESRARDGTVADAEVEELTKVLAATLAAIALLREQTATETPRAHMRQRSA
jgi:signal transduction histidine kinase/CheY-like chemotaxis protein/HPt (histidine-containing phosphotransfer) domain-containing protein